MKPSTRQRMVAIELDFPLGERELEIPEKETRRTGQAAADLIRLAQAVRGVQHTGLREVASTRTLVAAAGLIQEGLGFAEAATAAIAGPLSDDPELRDGLVGMISTGITERTLFRHVPSKAALFRDAVISPVEAFVEGDRGALLTSLDEIFKVEAGIRDWDLDPVIGVRAIVGMALAVTIHAGRLVFSTLCLNNVDECSRVARRRSCPPQRTKSPYLKWSLTWPSARPTAMQPTTWWWAPEAQARSSPVDLPSPARA
jgi:hypothetical protein